MIYDLSSETKKKLKDANFPGSANIEMVIPELSELIDACGDSFGNLERIKIGDRVSWYCHESNPQTIPIMMNYDTPEEAVANLWIALNKK